MTNQLESLSSDLLSTVNGGQEVDGISPPAATKQPIPPGYFQHPVFPELYCAGFANQKTPYASFDDCIPAYK